MLRARFDRRRFLHLTAGAGLLAAFPSLAFGAEGNYEAMLLTCIDPRFPEPTIKYMEGRHMSRQIQPVLLRRRFDRRGRARVQDLGAGVLGQSRRLDAAAPHPEVIAMNHRDCGAAKIAYGEDEVANPKIETETHKAALMEFKKQVGEKQPKLKVELGLMALDGKVEMFS